MHLDEIFNFPVAGRLVRRKQFLKQLNYHGLSLEIVATGRAILQEVRYEAPRGIPIVGIRPRDWKMFQGGSGKVTNAKTAEVFFAKHRNIFGLAFLADGGVRMAHFQREFELYYVFDPWANPINFYDINIQVEKLVSKDFKNLIAMLPDSFYFICDLKANRTILRLWNLQNRWGQLFVRCTTSVESVKHAVHLSGGSLPVTFSGIYNWLFWSIGAHDDLEKIDSLLEDMGYHLELKLAKI